ncbi:MAG: hypothetical protein O7E57_10815, partial [Gammaproteobacteria bacterium]|nr:hypothetical protein [Gammaproteobacteria bacterium]
LDECIMSMEELLRIDPHSTSASRYKTIQAMCLFQCDRFDEAIAAAREAISLRPLATGAYMALIATLAQQGNRQEAEAALAELRRQVPAFKLRDRFNMMRPLSDKNLLDRLRTALASVGLTE